MILYEEINGFTVTMTDTEIIEAVKCCSHSAGSCGGCPLQSLQSSICIMALNDNAYKLIMRQKRQIERLKRYDEKRDISLHARLIATAKTEAIKAFTEELKRNLKEIKAYINEGHAVDMYEWICAFLKCYEEMTEENENGQKGK